MSLNPKAILAYRFAPIEQVLDERDLMLYALSIGVGRDPMNRDELAYVYEQGPQTLRMFSTMPVVLGYLGDWRHPDMGITYSQIVHGSQRLTLHRPIAPGQAFTSQHRIVELVDKGADKGALIVLERRLVDSGSGEVLATMESTSFCRADGGFGGTSRESHEFKAVPSSVPERTTRVATDPNAALWYRLNGDRNPLHADPDTAAKAGFARPILHGLCTFGIAGLTALRTMGDLASQRLASIEARFSSPVLPGDVLDVDLWKVADGIAFRVRVAERDKVVLDRGYATLTAL